MVDWQNNFMDWVSYEHIVIKDEMNAAILKQHMQHFNQAKGPPFTGEPPVSLFGELVKRPVG
eukprot:792144-Ditylum_brightwellii.AAC.1